MIAHRFFLVCFVLCLSLFFSVSVVFAQSAGEKARVIIAEGLKTCLALETGRDACYAPLCEYEPGYLCAEDILDVAVEVAGPKKTMQILYDVMRSPIFSIASDGHLLSHIIGRAISRVFGPSGEHFLKCPSDFNNGCFHGFFEHTLPLSDSPVDVVASICENMPLETPSKERGYCYHGAGHVFMMQESHDLDRAIVLCLQLPGFGPENCWQGAFMENAGEREWEIKKKNFREDDPLYPCHVVEDRFKPECYINHHGYLIRHHSQSWDELVQMCLSAGDWIEPCIGGLGLMLGSEHWIGVVAQEFEHLTDADHVERTGFFCNRLPDEHIPTCYSYAIPSFLNFGHRDLSMVSRICSMASEEYRGDCFSRIGGYLTDLVSTPQDRVRPCSTVPAEWHSVCLGDEYIQTKRVIEGGLPDIPPVEAWQGSNQSSKQGILFFERIKGFFALIFKSVTNAFTPTVSAHSGDSSDTELVRLAHPELQEGVEECLALDGRGDCYASLCEYEPGYLCAEDLLHTVTVTNGPEVGIQMLQGMIAHSLFPFDDANEGHSLAHTVGRITSQYFGGGEAFLRCPTVLDYGCQHGFLEDALPKASSPAEAVTNICESLPEIPTIGRPNCYHGSGHGVMMNVSYNLHEAIVICDATLDPYSCSTGIMMENASGYVSGRIQDLYPENNSFEENNPQAPCDTLTDTIHRRTCYRQHMPYLAKYFDYDLREVVGVCLAAPMHTDVRDCVFGFGAYGIYDGIQASLLPGFEGDYMDKIIYMCNQFPESHRMHCYTPAIDASTVFYGVERASDFCDKIDSQHLRECYRAIGDRHQSLVMNEEEKIERCALVPEEYRIECTNPHQSRDGGQNTDATPTLAGNVISDGQGVRSVVEGGEVDGDRTFLSLKRFLTNITQFVLHLFSQIVAAQTPTTSNDYLAELVKRCLTLQEGQDGQKDRAKCYAVLCEYEPGYLCAEKILTSLIPVTSARDGMAVLQDMTWGGAFSFDPSAAHPLAHIIGMEMAKRYHLSGEGFLSCPIDFDYGCYHGFLEAGFLEGHTPYTLITQMCEMMPEVPAYAKVACYHGSGHALVMHYSYGLYEPLEQCDLLSEYWQSICWSGVFMENVNGVNSRKVGDEPDNGFRDDDPFAPCSTLDEKYKVLCYENMMPYWLETLRYSLGDLVALCDTVEEGYEDECIHSIGAYSIYPGNQRQLLGDDSEGNFIEKTIHICNKFPEEYRMRCYAPAIQQNFIYHGTKVISEFCEKIDEQYRGRCWEIIGSDIAGKVENVDAVIKTCYVAPERYRESCLKPYERRMQNSNNNNKDTQLLSAELSITDTATTPIFFHYFSSLKQFFAGIVRLVFSAFSYTVSAWSIAPVPLTTSLLALSTGVEQGTSTRSSIENADGASYEEILFLPIGENFFANIAKFVVGVFSIVSVRTNELSVDTRSTDDIPASSKLRAGVEMCMVLDGDRDACYAELCEYESSYLCAESIVDVVTALRGPRFGIRTLDMILKSPSFDFDSFLWGGHQLAHVVGRSAAKNWGIIGEVFNECPPDFSNGCHHGFFQGAAERGVSLFDIMVGICETFDDEYEEEKVTCYHSSGHGIMMESSYNLSEALLICGRLNNESYADYCGSGVFMEGAIGKVTGIIPKEYDNFSDENFLAPCDSFSNNSSHYNNCFSYHHRIFLPIAYSAQLEDLIALCLSSGDDEQVCLRHLSSGLTAGSGDVVTHELLPKSLLGNRAKRAGFLCGKFPEGYIDTCFYFAGKRLQSSTSVKEFCDASGKHYDLCLQQISVIEI